MLKEIWNYLLDQVRVEPEFEQVEISEGNLLVEEVRAIAQQVADKEGWDYLEAREILLFKINETGRLRWQVSFLLKGIKDNYYIGTQGTVNIDDETGEVESKSYIPR